MVILNLFLCNGNLEKSLKIDCYLLHRDTYRRH